MYILSPKLKNLYFSLTASSYAFSTFSLPANALTSIISVDAGRGKFVISPSITLNCLPGYMKMSVQPVFSERIFPSRPAVSSVLVEVVPTAITLPPLSFVLFTSSAVSLAARFSSPPTSRRRRRPSVRPSAQSAPLASTSPSTPTSA